MHVKIAWNIYQDRKYGNNHIHHNINHNDNDDRNKHCNDEQVVRSASNERNIKKENSSFIPMMAAGKSHRSSSSSSAKSKQQSHANSNIATVTHVESIHNPPQPAPPPSDPVLLSISNYSTTTVKALDPYNGLTTLTRSQSVTTITQQYPTRFGHTLSAPPNLPALYPPQPSGSAGSFDMWPRPPPPSPLTSTAIYGRNNQ
ncbi:hypothetical protein BLA29_010099, partial [Euroglyphus maynei]